MKQEGHSVSLICKVIKLPESSYYRKRKGKSGINIITDKKAARIEQESSLLEKIKEIKLVHLYWGYRLSFVVYLKLTIAVSSGSSPKPANSNSYVLSKLIKLSEVSLTSTKRS